MGWFGNRSKSPTPLSGAINGPGSAVNATISKNGSDGSSLTDIVLEDNDEPKKDDEKENEKTLEKAKIEEEKTKYTPRKKLGGSGALRENETETELNTNLNAMLYHFSEDSVDLYKSENNSLDLLGRAYYDDYNPSDRAVVEKVASFTSLSSLNRMSASASINQTISPTLSPQISNHLNPVYGSSSLFERQVSFDTLSDDHHSAITLKVKHPEFKFRRNNKTILVGYSNDTESLKAVEWAFLELLIHGDTLIVFHVLDEKTYKRVDPTLADLVLEKLKKLNSHSRRISLVLEIVVGNPQKLLKKAITEYKPAMMIVGTHQYGQAPLAPTASSTNLLSMNHHKHHHMSQLNLNHKLSSGIHLHNHKSLFSKTTVSEYFLQYALVPVIVVKPFYEIREVLNEPVNSETYFQDWLANIDVMQIREKKKKHIFTVRSPSLSRNSSLTNLNEMSHMEGRGRSETGTHPSDSRGLSRSSSRSRSLSRHKDNEEQNSATNLRRRLSRLLSY